MAQSPPSTARQRTFREEFRALGERPAPPFQGAFVTSPDPAFTLINGYAGLDFVVIDNEHSPLGPAEVVDIRDPRVGEAYEAALTSCHQAGKLIVGTEYFGRGADIMMHHPERSAYATLAGEAVERVRIARQEEVLW